MNRRDFFKRAGLGIGGLVVSKNLLARHLDSELSAQNTLCFVVDFLLKQGADYVDARIGECDLMGKSKSFLPNSLFRAEMLGIRIAKDDAWRHVVISDLSQPGLTETLNLILKAKPIKDNPEREWVAAVFNIDKVMAEHSSAPEVTKELDQTHLRFAIRDGIPNGTADLLFCDLLIVE